MAYEKPEEKHEEKHEEKPEKAKDEKTKTVKVTCYRNVQIADDLYERGEKYNVEAVRAAKYRTYFTNPKAK